MGSPTAAIVPYTLTFLLLLLAPGPDFAVVVRNAIRGGRPAGVVTAVGVASGLAVHGAIVALGLGAVIAASATAFVVVKLVGAVYLVGLGVVTLVGAFRRRRAAPVETDSDPAVADSAVPAPEPRGRRPVGMLAAYRQGLLCNVLNPKAIMTYLALMPQFLPAHPPATATLELSTINVAAAVLWFGLVALGVAAVRRVLLRERVQRAIDAVTGSVLVAFGARLAAAS